MKHDSFDKHRVHFCFTVDVFFKANMLRLIPQLCSTGKASNHGPTDHPACWVSSHLKGLNQYQSPPNHWRNIFEIMTYDSCIICTYILYIGYCILCKISFISIVHIYIYIQYIIWYDMSCIMLHPFFVKHFRNGKSQNHKPSHGNREGRSCAQ